MTAEAKAVAPIKPAGLSTPGEKVRILASEAIHANPKMQAHIEEAQELHETLVNQFNMQVENLSAGGIKRIIKSLVTFQDVKFKGDEFELFSLSEALLRGKVAIMLTAAAGNKVTQAVEQKEEQEAKEAAEAVAKEQEHGV